MITGSANVNILFQFEMRRNEEIPAFAYKMKLLFSKKLCSATKTSENNILFSSFVSPCGYTNLFLRVRGLRDHSFQKAM